MVEGQIDELQAGSRPLDLDDAVSAAVDAAGTAYREVVLALHAERLGEHDASAHSSGRLHADRRLAQLCKAMLGDQWRHRGWSWCHVRDRMCVYKHASSRLFSSGVHPSATPHARRRSMRRPLSYHVIESRRLMQLCDLCAALACNPPVLCGRGVQPICVLVARLTAARTLCTVALVRRKLASQKNAAMSADADEVARLKAELAALQQETAALEKSRRSGRRQEEEAQIYYYADDEAAKAPRRTCRRRRGNRSAHPRAAAA